MSVQQSKILHVAKFFTDANFYISVLVLVYGCLTAITENYCIFKFNEDLFGAMHNNLRMALLYLGMTELVVCMYAFLTGQPKLMIFIGYFLVMMLGSLAFYGKVNTVPIDNNLYVFFLYTGLSHIFYGLVSSLQIANRGEYLKS